jgi:hypothetical protein
MDGFQHTTCRLLPGNPTDCSCTSTAEVRIGLRPDVNIRFKCETETQPVAPQVADKNHPDAEKSTADRLQWLPEQDA